MRFSAAWMSFVLLMATASSVPVMALGCDECREIKGELRVAARDQAAPAATPSPTAPVVRVVLVWAEGCGHCHEILDGILPEVQQQYGAQLKVRLIEVVNMEDISSFFDMAKTYGFARGDADVPFLLIGQQALMGVDPIQSELAGLIERLLAAGGSAWPAMQVVSAGQATPAEQTASADSCGIAVPCTETLADRSVASTPGGARQPATLMTSAVKPLLAAGSVAGLLAVMLLAVIRARRSPRDRSGHG